MDAESVQQLYSYNDKSWGVYASPEVGVNVFPFRHKYVGINLAAYYSYASNRGEIFYHNMNGMNNWGVRVGFTF